MRHKDRQTPNMSRLVEEKVRGKGREEVWSGENG